MWTLVCIEYSIEDAQNDLDNVIEPLVFFPDPLFIKSTAIWKE